MLKFSKLFGSKKRSIRKASALVPVVAERLEARVVPAAGIVTAKIVGTSLTLTGDDSSNEVTVTVNDDGIFDMKNTVETFQNKSRDYLIKIFFLFVIACTILGFATFMKWLFHL